MRITFVTRKFGNVERNSHCDVLHFTPVRVANLVLDCNGVFAIKAYYAQVCIKLVYAVESTYYRASDFPRSRKSRGIRGIADLKRNLENSKKKKKNFQCQSHMAFSCFVLFVAHTQRWLYYASLIVHSHVNITVFLQFTALIVPFFFSSPH